MTPTDFFAAFRIAELSISEDTDISDRAVSRVEVAFGGNPEDNAPGYRVDFKVLDEAADVYRFLRGIGPAPGCTPAWTQVGASLGAERQRACITALLGAIEGRVAKVYKEQSILNIQPVGKSFLLMGRTRFEVLADDGEGQLRIRLHRPEGVTEAGLNANDLLDGLYSGLITRTMESMGSEAGVRVKGQSRDSDPLL